MQTEISIFAPALYVIVGGGQKLGKIGILRNNSRTNDTKFYVKQCTKFLKLIVKIRGISFRSEIKKIYFMETLAGRVRIFFDLGHRSTFTHF